jgi:hypothetical protein
MSELFPDAKAIVNAIVENAANAVRQAYVLGAQQSGSAALRTGAATTLEEWRTEMLTRYDTPSWKRSIVQLVPSCRFRPTEIYIAKRTELEVLQPDNKTLSVGTHNVLGALLKDGVIAKLGEFYAPAIGGVPLPADAADSTQSYRPRNSYSEHFARLLGFTVVSWSMLEWEIVDLAEALAPGTAASFLNQPYSTQALAFSDAVARFGPQHGAFIAGGLNALAAEFRVLAKLRSDLAAARPCTINGKNALRCNGTPPSHVESDIVWDNQTLMETCSSFERACAKAQDLSERLRFGRLPATRAALDALNLDDVENSHTTGAIAESVMPLIALGRVVSSHGARPYARALEQYGILDADEASVILRLARELERPRSEGGRDSRKVIEELWSGARSPGVIRRAIAHRARHAGKVPAELPAPLSGEYRFRLPILTVDGTTISIATASIDAWGENEVIVDLENRNAIDAAGAHVVTIGTRVLGNERAMQLVPWLVDGPV